MIRYTGENQELVIGTDYNYSLSQLQETKFILRRWGNTLIEAQPRYGKSVLVKDLIVKISKCRKVIIFDYAGEWQYNILKYNLWSEYPDRLVGAKVMKSFTFNIMSFNNVDDYASMGFQGMQAAIVCEIINQSVRYHHGDIELISEMLSNIPTQKGMHYSFNNKYGTNLIAPINFSTKVAISTWWSILKKYFWQGETDIRVIYDFAEEAKKTDHMIVHLSVNDPAVGVWMARTYCGKILEQMSKIWSEIKPVIVFEEARMLFPNWQGQIPLSSNNQAFNCVTHGPKLGLCCFFIVQHKSQIFQPILENIHSRILGVVQQSGGEEYKIPLTYNPEKNIREFLYIDVTSTPHHLRYKKFRPCVPCMEFVSDI